MFNLFFWLALLLAIAEWLAVSLKWQRLSWVAKPGMMVALILWFTLVGRWSGPLALVGLGLVCSLLGDIFLMLPARFFQAGMAAFFLTHLFYIVAFNHLPITFRWEAVLPVVIVAGSFAFLRQRICRGIECGGDRKLLIPVIGYALVLSLMWLAALTTLFRPGWGLAPAIMVSLGGSLFFLSDSVLAYSKFVGRIRHADLIVMVTYHLAQILIAAGALRQFLI